MSMEFGFDLSKFIHNEILIIESNMIFRKFDGNQQEKRMCTDAISTVLDKMGQASANAQGLSNPVTTSGKFKNSNHTVYLLIDETSINLTVIGFLKMGWKRLFLFDLEGVIWDKDCFCVLDFYIHESKQRAGYGKRLFDYMLQDNGISPEKIPIDRPSKKSLQFLFKHYNLKTIIPQANNFVVFQHFFQHDK